MKNHFFVYLIVAGMLTQSFCFGQDPVEPRQKELEGAKASVGTEYLIVAADAAIRKGKWTGSERVTILPGDKSTDLEFTQEPAKDIHVSPMGSDANSGTEKLPLKTLHAAQAAVRAIKKKGMPEGGINVILHNGTYALSEPLTLGIGDSGEPDKPVVWKSAEGAKPIISGGVPVTGWSKYKNGIWQAKLVRKEKLRQLYVNERPADMAAYGQPVIPIGWRDRFRITGQESWAAEPGYAYEGMAFKAEDVPEIARPEDLEFQQRRTWTIQRSNVTGIRQQKLQLNQNTANENNDVQIRDTDVNAGADEINQLEKVISLARPVVAIGMNLRFNCGFSTKSRKEVYLYNALEFVDQPGEFCFDRSASTLYYMPRPGQDMTTATVLIPALDQLVRIKGTDVKNHAHDITFEGLTFSHTGWQMMPIGDSYGAISYQSSAMSVTFLQDGDCHGNPNAGIYTSMDVPPGVISINSGERFAIRNCVFRNLGMTALNIENDVQDVTIRGNVFYWVEGSGVNIGHPHHTYIGKENDDNNGFGPYHIDNSKDKWDETVEGLIARIRVRNNLFRNTCWTWWQMSPIAVYYGHSIYVEHNDILDAPYIGITMGWGWGEFNGIANERHYHRTLGKIGGKPSLTVNDIKVNRNRIVNPYTRLTDTGGIYFIGDQAMQIKGKVPQLSEVIGNYLAEPRPKGRNEASLIYTDEGTAYLFFKDNIIDGEMGIWRIFQRGLDSRYKIFERNFFRRYPDSWRRHKEKWITDENCSEKDNVYLDRQRNDKPFTLEQWPDEAQKLIRQAGLEPEYEHLFRKLMK